MTGPSLPRSLLTNPRLSQWIAFEAGRVLISSGKVELGQGILTALQQIAADELCVDMARVEIVSGQAPLTPDEVYTAGSQSVEMSGGAIGLVCAQVRETLVAIASDRLGLDPATCSVRDGRVHADGAPTGIDYWGNIDALDLDRPCDGSAPLLSRRKPRFVGMPVARIDLSEKVFGGGFIHDLTLEGMRHARVLRGGFRDARLATLDEARVRRAAPVDILRIGGFTALVAKRQRDVEVALAAARPSASWTVDAPDADAGTADWLVRQQCSTRTIQAGAEPAPSNSAIRLRFSRPYLSHGSIGPSCAIARFDAGRLEVWTHSQGVEQLRQALSMVLDIDIANIAVSHRHGAGCYGHNGADDAACDAAMIAKHFPGVPIRVQWTRSDELSAAPLGAAMAVEASATLGEDGMPADWKLEIWSGSHGQRPAMAGRPNLLAAEEAGLAQPAADVLDVPDAAGGGGTRNAFAPYVLRGQTITHNLLTRPTPHTSALRGLGAQVNVLAIEGMMDELAAAAAIDPVAYRLRSLPDERARRVLARCAELCRWSARGEAGTGVGLGIACSRYKNHAAHVALAARVEIEDEVRLTDIWCVADAGLVVNPDGARNQIEGGIIQAASWTLKEAFSLGDETTVSRGWSDYPILRFSEVPEITLEMIDAPDLPPLGVGEVAVGPASAAIANAASHALGARLSTLPLTRETIAAALLRGA
ncbi:molybdopterin cofactor-binding domain-containing protein [Mesorhizobium sp. CAU 1741]|uniref:molybdopterin cofactor-binding domain-containing protein n=1 Tax=Mesorhizobium sp. CAU 1741 TaxID=3140366 RepID=UPI00325AE61D